MMYDTWNKVFEILEQRYPHITSQQVGWHPSGRNEITVKLSSGNSVIYNYVNNTVRAIVEAKPNINDYTEDQWRQEFANRLCALMLSKGITPWQLSEMTGISEVSISRYRNGKATPSGFNMDKICRVLDCSSSELTDII